MSRSWQAETRTASLASGAVGLVARLYNFACQALGPHCLFGNSDMVENYTLKT
jgi:hypothetical protein